MTKSCRTCKEDLPIELFPKAGSGRTKAHCKSCYNKKQRSKYTPSPKILKYKNEEERQEAARQRAKEWYENNKERAKERISSWQKSEHGKEKRRQARIKNKERQPQYWRAKKKRDKNIRRVREKNIPPLDFSSITFLESYNNIVYNTTEFHCEFCDKPVGSNYWLEHLIPLSRGGNNDLENLAITCPACNLEKGFKLLEEYNPNLIDKMKNRFNDRN